MSRTVHSEHGVGSLSWRSVIEPMTLLATAIARSKDSRLSIASCQHTYLIETSNLELLSATHGVNRCDAAYSTRLPSTPADRALAERTERIIVELRAAETSLPGSTRRARYPSYL